jgi:hypothetical protein
MKALTDAEVEVQRLGAHEQAGGKPTPNLRMARDLQRARALVRKARRLAEHCGEDDALDEIDAEERTWRGE